MPVVIPTADRQWPSSLVGRRPQIQIRNVARRIPMGSHMLALDKMTSLRKPEARKPSTQVRLNCSATRKVIQDDPVSLPCWLRPRHRFILTGSPRPSERLARLTRGRCGNPRPRLRPSVERDCRGRGFEQSPFFRGHPASRSGFSVSQRDVGSPRTILPRRLVGCAQGCGLSRRCAKVARSGTCNPIESNRKLPQRLS
jgi:hypothetical protein